MQLSVFLTPIFASTLGLGFGVCDELAVFSPQHAVSTVDHGQMTGMSGMAMADMAPTTLDHASPAQPLNHHSSHHLSHALCGFCLLLGHSVLPPSFLIDALYTQTATQLHQRFVVSTIEPFLALNKTLRPQGRAPPVLFV
jgi:hypothetical protein